MHVFREGEPPPHMHVFREGEPPPHMHVFREGETLTDAPSLGACV